MFTQFFGNFLLNKKLVTPEELSAALAVQKSTRLKLGVLAINAGFMTAAQIEKVHEAQATIDKRIGDLSVDMGFITNEQLNTLLSTQKTGHLLLGQALVDSGCMSNAQFESALNEYKTTYSITEEDFTSEQNDKMASVISNFYHFNTLENDDVFTEYVSLFFKNMVRFVGDDFTPLSSRKCTEYETTYFAKQCISGEFNALTIVDAPEKAFMEFAGRFANEKFEEIDEYVDASVGEFMNLHNGLFAVNMSNERGMDLQLTPQATYGKKVIKSANEMFVIQICFPFGVINLILSDDIMAEIAEIE